MTRELRVGTRGSDLARWQAETVLAGLRRAGRAARLVFVSSEGDSRPDLDLARASEVGVFTAALQAALSEDRVDLAVHSLKDLPTTSAVGLAVAAVLPRAPVHDVLLVRPDAVAGGRPLPLVEGARVGTGAPRRIALLAAADPAARPVQPFRGNVPTRVHKCVRGDVEAVVLAGAGLGRLRLDPSPLVPFALAPEMWLPAPGQGAIAVELRADDADARAAVAPLHCAGTAAAVTIERRLLARLEAGCHAAVGAWAREGELLAGALGPDRAWHRVAVSAGGADPVAAAHAALLAASPAAPPSASPAAPPAASRAAWRAGPGPTTGTGSQAWARPAERWW